MSFLFTVARWHKQVGLARRSSDHNPDTEPDETAPELGPGGIRMSGRLPRLPARIRNRGAQAGAAVAGLSATRIGGMFARFTAWLRRRHVTPPDDLDTREELEAREEGRRLLEDKDTYRTLGRAGPDVTSGGRRDAGH